MEVATPTGGRTSAHPRRWVLRAAAVLAVAAVVYAVASSGLLSRFTDQDELRSTVESAGVWAPVVFLGLMVLLVPLNVPGLLFVIPATTLFGTVGGVALSLVGGFVASAIGVVGARRLGRDALVRRLPSRLQHLEARLCEQGFWAVAALRSVTFLMQPVDWLCGLTRMPMRTILSATFVGLIPPTLVIALTGGGLLELVL
ncbi:MAG TPA: VTT domain-containing protein [Acidimicrobiales bacterium]|nr:VTT domain-containing protein [Acidimicrobiales bacterium]